MEEKIMMGHGSGGKLMNELIDEVICTTINTDTLQLDDSALLSVDKGKIAFTTDSYTITPLFFKGGDIGKLAVNGTVNDLSVMGAEPKFISCSLIIEEGFSLESLKKILISMNREAEIAGVSIVTGDTKVVEKGKADKLFINTAGIGILKKAPLRKEIKTGDKIIVNGTIGDHGIAILAQRNGFTTNGGLCSDCAPLNDLIQSVMEQFHADISFVRDATRGGVVSVLNELVKNKPFCARIIEEDLPVKEEVAGVCEILGVDPLYAANEGKIILVVKKEKAEEIVRTMRKIKTGKEACIIGEISAEFKGKVFVETLIKGKRMLQLGLEEQLPRIC